MFNLMVVPDYLPDQFSLWYLLNTYLQKSYQKNISLVMPGSFKEVAEIQSKEPVSMIYINPFSADLYVRQQGYLPLVRPKNKFDEVMIVCSEDAPWQVIEDLKGEIRLALSHNEDANFVGLRLLEPAGLSKNELKIEYKDNFPTVASALVRNKADVGVIQVDVFNHFSPLTQQQLRTLVTSRMSNELSHVWLLHPDYAAEAEAIRNAIMDMATHPEIQDIYNGLGIPEGFELLDEEDLEFMIDVVDTLRE